jgi:hypothetical protein
VRQYSHRLTVRGASPIFTPPINWSLQNGNGNLLKKRRQQN